MKFLPIVGRELRVAARQWRTYWGRTTVGVVAFALTLYLMWVAQEVGSGIGGTLLLKIVSYIVLFFCIFAGGNRTADSISSEKRDDTLGLLFLTHLRSPDIVLGKLAASTLHSLLFVVSTLPILAIPVMLGGVTFAELVCIPVSLLNALFFAMSISILASTLCKAQRRAMLASSISMIILVLLLPGIGLTLRMEWDMPLAATLLSLSSPLFAHEMSFNATFGLSRMIFWLAIAIQSSISVACITAACLLLPHVWQVKASEPVGWRARLRSWTLGPLEVRRARRTRFLLRNPIFWLGARERFAPFGPFLFMAVLAGGGAWAILYYKLPASAAAFVTFFCLAIIDFQFRVRVANISAMSFARERQMGTWEMILSTPLTIREIVRGNRLAVRNALLPSYLFFLLCYALAVYTWGIVLEGKPSQLAIAVMFGVISSTEFVILGYVAMWRGMAAFTPIHAPAQALVRVTVAPWVAWALLLPVVQEVNFLKVWFDEYTIAIFVGVTSTIWLINIALVFRSTWRNLHRHFRDPSQAPSLWRKLAAGFLALVNPSPPLDTLQPSPITVRS